MKLYTNTSAFDKLIAEYKIPLTKNPQEAEILVLGAKKVNYAEFVRLKAVYRFGVGVENVDFDLLKEKSIALYFPSEETKKVLYDSTADFTVYAILYMLNRDAFGDVELWKKNERGYLTNKITLVIGTGNIGGRVVEKLKMFMQVITYDSLTNTPGELKDLVKQADIITIHLPLMPSTKYFFNSEKLSWVKENAVIINTSRGDLFDEDALFKKLQTSECRAFFDVFWNEPYQGRLKELGKEKFFMTPHTASNTKEFVNEGFKDILRIIEELKNA